MFLKVFDYIKVLKNIDYTKIFEYISTKKSILGFIYFGIYQGIYQLIYNALCFSNYYKNTNDQICQTDNLEKKIDISFNKDSLNNCIYDISLDDITLDNITLDDILQIEDKNRNNIQLIDKSIQCELNIEEMVNIGDLEIKYSLPNDISDSSTRFRWFFG